MTGWRRRGRRSESPLELARVRELLANAGSFHLAYQPLDPSTARDSARRLQAKLEAGGFEVTEVKIGRLAKATAVAVNAR